MCQPENHFVVLVRRVLMHEDKKITFVIRRRSEEKIVGLRFRRIRGGITPRSKKLWVRTQRHDEGISDRQSGYIVTRDGKRHRNNARENCKPVKEN